jgi:hypothetical protein
MDDQQKQHIIDLPKTVAGAIATPLAALLTSRFGVAGTMVGLALTAVIVTVMVDTLKVYLARVPGAVTSIPGGLKKKSAWGGFLGRLRSPFSKLSSLPPSRRRSILIRSLIGGVIVFIIGLVVVTGVEASVGKNLSCWAWDDCYTESSAEAGNASDASGLPSIFIAGNSIGASAPQVGSPVPQQQPAPATPVAPTPPASPSSSGKGTQPSVSQRPSAPPSEQQSSSSTGYEQQTEYQEPQGEYQQQSEYSQQDEYQQQSVTSDSESERQSYSSSSETQLPSDSQQRSPTPSEGADEAGWSW